MIMNSEKSTHPNFAKLKDPKVKIRTYLNYETGRLRNQLSFCHSTDLQIAAAQGGSKKKYK